MVCKYSEDDYRTMARLQEKSWFVEAIVPPKEYLKTVLVSNEETGENQLVYEKDKKRRLCLYRRKRRNRIRRKRRTSPDN